MAVQGPNGISQLAQWLPPAAPLRLLEVGCGPAEDAAAWLRYGVTAYVGVDLDEMAIQEARGRWPGMTFLCEDAARLTPEAVGRFHAVLVRRPDLLARPANWCQVFAALPPLVYHGGRVLITVLSRGEAALARRWLLENGFRLVIEQPLADGQGYLLVAEAGW